MASSQGRRLQTRIDTTCAFQDMVQPGIMDHPGVQQGSPWTLLPQSQASVGSTINAASGGPVSSSTFQEYAFDGTTYPGLSGTMSLAQGSLPAVSLDQPMMLPGSLDPGLCGAVSMPLSTSGYAPVDAFSPFSLDSSVLDFTSFPSLDEQSPYTYQSSHSMDRSNSGFPSDNSLPDGITSIEMQSNASTSGYLDQVALSRVPSGMAAIPGFISRGMPSGELDSFNGGPVDALGASMSRQTSTWSDYVLGCSLPGSDGTNFGPASQGLPWPTNTQCQPRSFEPVDLVRTESMASAVDDGVFAFSPTSGSSGRRASDDLESNPVRNHPIYQATPGKDGLYHCPWEKDCNHRAEALKCNYHKHIDSHLKPYRCKVASCSKQQFSSTACLLRHEREAHGMHGHGEKPFLCPVKTCERSGPGNGFPRKWNLEDHKKRVHSVDHQDAPKATTKRKPTKTKKATVKGGDKPGRMMAATAMEATQSFPGQDQTYSYTAAMGIAFPGTDITGFNLSVSGNSL